jgi:hypothetical protein
VSIHIEEIKAASSPVTWGELEDQDPGDIFAIRGEVLQLGNDDIVAISGTPEEIRALLTRALGVLPGPFRKGVTLRASGDYAVSADHDSAPDPVVTVQQDGAVVHIDGNTVAVQELAREISEAVHPGSDPEYDRGRRDGVDEGTREERESNIATLSELFERPCYHRDSPLYLLTSAGLTEDQARTALQVLGERVAWSHLLTQGGH